MSTPVLQSPFVVRSTVDHSPLLTLYRPRKRQQDVERIVPAICTSCWKSARRWSRGNSTHLDKCTKGLLDLPDPPLKSKGGVAATHARIPVRPITVNNHEPNKQFSKGTDMKLVIDVAISKSCAVSNHVHPLLLRRGGGWTNPEAWRC